MFLLNRLYRILEEEPKWIQRVLYTYCLNEHITVAIYSALLQRCGHLCGSGPLLCPGDGGGLRLGPRAPQADLGRVGLGKPQGVGPVCQTRRARSVDDLYRVVEL